MKSDLRALLLLTIALFAAGIARAQSGTATLAIQANQPGAVVSSNLFGIFFEEINYAGEGGLYAELVRNRSLDNSPNPDFWTQITTGTATGQMVTDSNQPLNPANARSLRLTMQSGTGSVGAGNSGFWGMSLQSGATYDLSFYARGTNGFSGRIGARLESANGSTLYAQTSFTGLTTNWQPFAASLVSSGTDTNARLVLSITNSGAVWLDVVSLFPRATFNNRTNGLRADLANMLAALQPSFFRYPGGNFIESFNVTNAVRWKKTVGDLAQRPGHLNDAWGYWSTDGFGLHEFFLFCEDLGMEPLYGINCGLMLNYNGNTNNTVPIGEMGPWVQDALDLIEYANGDTNTTWGAVRAANGHPAPFNLKYLEIGNENGGSYYNDRYALFYDALKAAHPEIKLIACVWGGTPNSRPLEIIDEHYYSNPGTFLSYATKYDNYNRAGPKVFVGEYAVTSGYGIYGNLSAALGEAAFMTGMERNSDIVQLASYAPLFANVNGIQWHPDLIYYDSGRVFGTPAYFVQKLFSQNRGDAVLPVSVAITSAPTSPPPHGAIGVGSWSTSVQYTNIIVTSNGVTLYQSDFIANGTNGWRVFQGTWSTNAGLYQQTSSGTIDCRSTTGNTNWANYTISLTARKVSGSEGFLILFNWTDDNNWTWFNVGGWGNTLNGIEQNVGGTKTILGTRTAQFIATDTWYDLSIVLTNSRIQCYVNGALVQDVIYPAAVSGLVASATYAKSAGQIVIKAVNPYTVPMVTTFNLAGVNSIAPTGTVIQLTSPNATDENSLTSPNYVSPVTNTLSGVTTNFVLTLPANSFSVVRLATTNINHYTNLLLQVPSPINSGQMVASTVWGQQSGNSFNLTTNSNHALSFASANTNIAVVDLNGNVTGIASGTADIIANYAALGLAATQSVQVIYVPTTLVHQYKFSETSGTNAADVIGGPAWNGTLPRGGAWVGGEVVLAAGGQQYVQLPAGILSNYAAVTIEAWVTFPNQLPINCFFFGFGNTNGSSGNSYIFCAPRAGRIAITAGNFLGEQNANSSSDFSFRTNFHLTAVFNPPSGYLALYTNGVFAAINNSVTVPFSSVNDVYNWIGRSLYSGDPYPDFSLDEFRIYNGALQAADIAATQVLGPNQLLSLLSPNLSASASGGNLILSWPVASAGFTVLTTTNLSSGSWTTAAVSPQIVGNRWQVTLPINDVARFYRLQK